MQQSPLRLFRKAVEIGIPIIGIVLVLTAVVITDAFLYELGLVVVGLLMIEAGVWNLAQPVLPNTRKFFALRTEVDRFIWRVRDLNASAIELKNEPSAGARQRYEDLQAEMHQMVDRMAAVAGMTDEEIAAQRGSARTTADVSA